MKLPPSPYQPNMIHRSTSRRSNFICQNHNRMFMFCLSIRGRTSRYSDSLFWFIARAVRSNAITRQCALVLRGKN
ncbi:CLUMA_CG018409, isoform A [Clunio marinus]|uniref:CLUMA_CG018409, isoform A n=1 Tax=Clunio marinus TaxID=568069 RepID=A0A1J1IYE1_9DIPT|nr:CLUMA_CG018409, isoform A [Clunio marinus]